MIEVVVEEDCTNTVARTPIISPAIGLVVPVKTSPAPVPAISLNASERTEIPMRKK